MKEPFCGARCYLNALMLVEICLALVIIIVTTVYYHILSNYIVPRDRKILFGQLFNFYIFGFQVIVLYIASLILWRRLWCLPYTRDVHMFVNLWLFISTIIIICGFGTVWSVSACIDEMEAAAETAMLNGIDSYYTCPDWKILWDELQFFRQCCGVNSYTDWMDAFWMSEIAARGCVSGTSTTYAPYACCRRDCISCYENFTPNTHNVGSLNVSFINTAGCLPLFTQNLWRLIYIVLGLLMVSLKLQAFICVLVRFILNRQCAMLSLSEDSSSGSTKSNCDWRLTKLKSMQSIVNCEEAQQAASNCKCEEYSSTKSLEKCCNCRATYESEVIH